MGSMAVRVTGRNLPELMRDELAARAALAGKSKQAHLRERLERTASKQYVRISAPPRRACSPSRFAVTFMKTGAGADARLT